MTKADNRKNPTPQELQSEDSFEKLRDLDHNDMVPFILENLKARNPITAAFKHGTMILITVVLFLSIGQWDTGAFFLGVGAGILFTFTIGVLLHELLHLIVYKILGARSTRLKLILHQGAIAAVADHFVISDKEFYWLAFTPFCVLTLAALFALFLTWGWIFYGVSTFLVLHATACLGDFSLAGFMYEHRHEGVYTFDDVENERSFFYRKRRSSGP
jgi:hypothetical protein